MTMATWHTYRCPRCGLTMRSELPHARFAHHCPAARGREVEWRRDDTPHGPHNRSSGRDGTNPTNPAQRQAHGHTGTNPETSA